MERLGSCSHGFVLCGSAHCGSATDKPELPLYKRLSPLTLSTLSDLTYTRPIFPSLGADEVVEFLHRLLEDVLINYF